MRIEYKNGICIVAVGHPQYGRMAFTLAASIKAVESSVNIAVLHSGIALNHIGKHQIKVFDEIIEVGPEVPANTCAKLHVPKYSPFENNLVIDADTLWLPEKKPSELFESLKDVNFTGVTEGKEGDTGLYYFWCDPGEARTKYEFKAPMHQWRTEFMYYNQEGAKIINRALEITQNHGLATVSNFAHAVPDELGVNIAAAEAGISPHIYKWKASYWHQLNHMIVPPPRELYEKYYIMSFGSNRNSNTIKKMYDRLASAACSKIGLQHLFSILDKKSFLPTVRDKM
jgi:hypothetical protein